MTTPPPSRELSASAQRVRAVAAEHFAERGYDGASLSAIAADAGMRKASLYAHFASKEELFAGVLAAALRAELLAAAGAFAAEPAEQALPGGEYLRRLPQRYASSADLRLLLRTGYAPPPALRDPVMASFRGFEAGMRELFAAALPAALPPDTAATLTEAYLGVVDGLQVELIYVSPESFATRRRALWAALGALVAQSAAARD